MITNIPKSDDFTTLSVQYLAQSIDLILNTELAFGDYFLNSEDITDELWEYHQGTLGNSLIMLFLSIENYLKSEICKVSPLLLLGQKPSEWNVKNADKDFEDLYLHQFDDLLVIYQELLGENLGEDLKQDFEELRKKRNKCTHGVLRELLLPSYILEIMHSFLSQIWKDNWLIEFRHVLLVEDIYGVDSEACENLKILKYYKLFEKYFNKTAFNELIRMPNKGRRFTCPSCEFNRQEAGSIFDVEYALITPGQDVITCYLCQGEFEFTRRDCVSDTCKSDVIFTIDDGCELGQDVCLSCLTEQDG